MHPNQHNSLEKSGRGGQIRTDDIRVPNAALYQAELRPGARGGPLGIPEDESRTSFRKFTFWDFRVRMARIAPVFT